MLKKKEAKEWAEKLRSGKFEQITGKLYEGQDSHLGWEELEDTPPNGFCCLGVLAKHVKGYSWGDMVTYNASGPFAGEIIPELEDGHFIDYNDEDGLSFDQIADIIDKVLAEEEADWCNG